MANLRALITGIDGFVGKYLARYLLGMGYKVYGTTIIKGYSHGQVEIYHMDVLEISNVKQVIQEIMPNEIYHLAGQSAVGLSWGNPTLTMSVNINGTINLLDATREYCKNAKVLIIGSSDQYGMIKAQDCPVSEENSLNPCSPYAISKCAQEQIATLYINSYNMNIIRVRAFNHIGPGQATNFVIPDFANKIVEIERGANPILKVGNLEAYRDFTDVRDIVVGYYLLMQKGSVKKIYNIGSGTTVKIADILALLLSMSNTAITVEIDKDKLRPIDVPIIQCDNTKIIKDTGWKIEYNLETTLKDVIEECRRK